MEALLSMTAAAGGRRIDPGLLRRVVALEYLTRAAPGVAAAAAGAWRAWRAWRQRPRQRPRPPEPPKSACVTLTRRYASERGAPPDDDLVDGVLHHVASLPQARAVRFLPGGAPIVAHPEPVELDRDVYARVLSTRPTQQGDVDSIEFEVYSHARDLADLLALLRELEEQYRAHKQNRLGGKLYYLDHVPVQLPGTIEGGLNYDVAPRHATFTMTPFRTTRSLSNVYGDMARRVARRVRFFLDNREWYERKGVPYTLGILMHGPPGCGKTSLIKAIAHDCKRHVVNVQLGRHTTASQLSNLFLSEKVHVLEDGATHGFVIPPSRRMLVFEEVDCADSCLARRGADADADAHAHPQKPTLATLLNLMDGVLETPGRILVMTTNHPERLDPALLRPGRIDLLLEFGRCAAGEACEIVEGITDAVGLPPEARRGIPDGVWTPAEVCERALQHVDDPERALRALRVEP